MTQEEALTILKMGYNVFLTGAPGSGKTYLLKRYISYLKQEGVKMGVTASTGIAATHLNGITIHSWSGLGIREELTERTLKKLMDTPYLKKRIEDTEVLIIDEISMLHDYQFDFINKICRAIRNDPRPFGGIQVVCAGDFFQLPPVSKKRDNPRFVTLSQIWSQMDIKVCYLKEQHRHQEEELSKILKEIRTNSITRGTVKTLLKQKKKKFSLNVTPTKLYTHNKGVSIINKKRLDQINKKQRSYTFQKEGEEHFVKFLINNSIVPKKLVLKKEAVVMFIKNNFDKGYVNGTLGKVIGFKKGKPVIETTSGKKIVTEREEWKVIEETGYEKAKIIQFPLRLAWAITIHKSQGMSLDAAEINLSKAFTPGMGYVALSRVKSLTGLKLMGLNKTALKVRQEAIELDKKFKKKSKTMKNYLKNSSEKEIKEMIKERRELACN